MPPNRRDRKLNDITRFRQTVCLAGLLRYYTLRVRDQNGPDRLANILQRIPDTALQQRLRRIIDKELHNRYILEELLFINELDFTAIEDQAEEPQLSIKQHDFED